MPESFLFFVRIMFAGLFVATLLAGGYLFANFQKLFGVDSSVPSENGSARSYSRMQVFSVWAHAVVLTGAFALLLH
jgi:hypothetical protein